VPPDKPILKTKIRIGVLGPLAGLLLGLMLAGFSEYFDHRLQSAEDVKRYLGCPTLGIVPKASA
jgi:capsular polysaccharide biosynthesis protein